MFLPCSRLNQGAVELLKLKWRAWRHLDDAISILKLPLFLSSYMCFEGFKCMLETWHFLHFPSEKKWGEMKVYCCRGLYNIYLWILMLSIPAFSGNCIQMFSVFQYLFIFLFFLWTHTVSLCITVSRSQYCLHEWKKKKINNKSDTLNWYNFLFVFSEDVLCGYLFILFKTCLFR